MVRPKSFDELADRLAEGRPVDWDAVDLTAASADERDWIRNLRLIDDIGRVARSEDPSSVVLGDADATSGVVSATPAAQDTVATWGRLQLLEEIGRGSFGRVFRGWDPALNRQVAVKLMNARMAELPDAGQRVLEEARLLARVEHPNVVRIYGIEEHDAQLGIWMEFVEGTDLGSVALERGRMEPTEAARLMAGLCDAVGAVHAANVVHKDIKAANVMVRPDGRPVLMDFGAGRTRRLREGENELVVTGTPRYMAPETFRREPATPQSDVYSLGVLLYHLLTGDFPVSGTVAEIMQKHEGDERTPLHEYDLPLPEDLVAIVERATAAEREDRFPSAAAMAGALRGFAGAEQETAVPRRTFLAWSLVGAVVIAAVATGLSVFSSDGPLQAQVRFTGVNEGQFVQLEPGDEIGADTGLEVKVRLSRDAYVYVLNRDDEGATTLLWPMANAGPVEPLEGGREHTIPGDLAGRTFRWPVAPIEGDERFLIVASVEPMPRFEDAMETAQVARIDASGIRPREVGDLALSALSDEALETGTTRGVTGLRPAAEDDRDVFAIAEKFGGQNPDGTIVLHHVRFHNVGR